MDFASTKQLPDYQLHAFLTLFPLGFFFSFEVKHPGKICQLVGVRNHSIFWLPPQKRVASGEHVDCRHPVGQRQRDGQRHRQRHGQRDEHNDSSGGVRNRGGCLVPGKMCCFFTKDMGKLYLKFFGRQQGSIEVGMFSS